MRSVELNNGLLLGACAALAILVIVGAFKLTYDTISATEQRELQSTLTQLLPEGSYNNEPANDTIKLIDPALGSADPSTIYRARIDGIPSGAVVSAVAPEGYNGAIHLLIGFDYQGNLVAVRVTQHNETPGLGDDIDVRRSDWIHAFDALSADELAPHEWQVKKYGGRFDQFTGATITPSAIVRAVHRVMQWYPDSREAIFE